MRTPLVLRCKYTVSEAADMEDKKGKVALNDELLDKVTGGLYETFCVDKMIDRATWELVAMRKICPICGSNLVPTKSNEFKCLSCNDIYQVF